MVEQQRKHKKVICGEVGGHGSSAPAVGSEKGEEEDEYSVRSRGAGGIVETSTAVCSGRSENKKIPQQQLKFIT